MSAPSTESWLQGHSYLRPLAELRVQVDRAAAEIGVPSAPIPEWESYREEFETGVPLLASTGASIELEPAAARVGELLGRLEAAPLAEGLAAEVSALSAAMRRGPEISRGLLGWLLGGDGVELPAPGLSRFLGWTLLEHSLRPAVEDFARWRDEERWLRRYCPTCGAPPAMAQIAGTEPARHRLLSCGCCRARWRFRRTQCPFCENDVHRISGITMEGEPALRIDHCEACKGYLKTYVGEGSEGLFLADWTSLHLDLLALDRGLKRLGRSLYDVESLLVT